MIQATFLVLILSVCSISAEVDEECSIIAESACQSVGDMVKKIEPIKIEGILPTEWCKIVGISGIELIEGKDVITTKNSAQTSSIFFVQFPKLNIDCLLQLDENPANIPAVIMKGMNDATKNNCPPDRQGEAAQGMKNTPLPTMGLQDMLKLKECAPVLPSVPGMSGGGVKGGISGGGGGISIGRKKRETLKGFIHIQWDKVQVSFQTVVKAGTNTVRIYKVAILSKDLDKIRVKCDGDVPKFEKSCKCVVATKFPVNLVVNAIYLILPCTVDETAQKYDDITQYFECPEN